MGRFVLRAYLTGMSKTAERKAFARWENEGGSIPAFRDLPLPTVTEHRGKVINNEENTNGPPGNRIMKDLPSDELALLSARSEQVTLNYGYTIFEPGDPISDVYFPESGIVSLLTAFDDKATLEVGVIGNEGILGLSVFLGAKISVNRAIVQGAGVAVKIGSADFLSACRDGGELNRRLKRFAHSLFAQVSLSAACYRFHPIGARLSRWLLMTSDRMGSDEFPVTQAFLSGMLGVRREAVNRASVDLQNKELITYNRGVLSILDRPGLSGIACRCYEILKIEEQDPGPGPR